MIRGFYNSSDADMSEERRINRRGKFERIERKNAGPYFSIAAFHMVDGVWETFFRYLDVFDRLANFGAMTDLENAHVWKATFAHRPSIINSPPEGYPEQLKRSLLNSKYIILQL